MQEQGSQHERWTLDLDFCLELGSGREWEMELVMKPGAVVQPGVALDLHFQLSLRPPCGSSR